MRYKTSLLLAGSSSPLYTVETAVVVRGAWA